MPTVPYSRVVNVSLTRRDNFPTIRGFGVPLLLSSIVSDATAGAVDATTPTKVYGTIEEVAVDWTPATDIYRMAQQVFSQNPAPVQLKVGYCDPAAITVGMDALYDYDSAWYIIVPDHNVAWYDWDVTGAVVVPCIGADELALWVESHRRLVFFDSADAREEAIGDTANIAYRMQNQEYTRTSVFYHPSVDDIVGGVVNGATTTTEWLAAAVAAYASTRNYDNVNSAFTAKFKGVVGVPDIDRGSAAVQAVTGFVPGTGQDNTQGYFANTYIDIGGQSFLVEGTMADGGFIDEIMFQDWLVTRTEEEVLAMFLNNQRVPYTDKGVLQIIAACERVLHRAYASGAITEYTDDNGDVHPWYIETKRVVDVSAAQRRQRIAPAIKITFRYTNAIHYATIEYIMTW